VVTALRVAPRLHQVLQKVKWGCSSVG